jgi:hypothetical protein
MSCQESAALKAIEERLEERLERLEQKIDLIAQCLECSIAPDCQRMGSHIAFVEGVYDRARAPLEWISRRITGDQETQYPMLQASTIAPST